MNLLLLHHDDFIDRDRARITGRRMKHLRTVLNISTGQAVKLGIINGKVGKGTVLSLTDCELVLEVKLTDEPPPPLPVTVILAMPRPKVLKRILQGMTAMGIKEIILLNSWRVEKSYWLSPVLEPVNLREQLILGLEQARDTVLPTIEQQRLFKPFVEDTLPDIAAGTLALVAHPETAQPCPVNVDQPVTLAIGPEGGFTPYEIEKLVAAGLSPVQLGIRPLRVETAVPALLGRLTSCL